MNFESIDVMSIKEIEEMYENFDFLSVDGPYYACYCTRGRTRELCADYNNYTYSTYYTVCPTLGSGIGRFYGCSNVCAAVNATYP